MEIQETKRKQTMQSTSLQENDSEKLVVKWNYSREKIRELVEAQKDAVGKDVVPTPERNAVDSLYQMYLRIGGIKELPSDNEAIDFYLKDFWKFLYLENKYVPVDIPFDVLIKEFIKALVHGEAERKGNNQAELCRAMNKWVQDPDVRNKLYQTRDIVYSKQKPKQIPKKSFKSGSFYENQTNREIKEMYQKIKMLYSDEKIAKCLNEFCAKSEVAKVVNEYIKRFPEQWEKEQNQKDET